MTCTNRRLMFAAQSAIVAGLAILTCVIAAFAAIMGASSDTANAQSRVYWGANGPVYQRSRQRAARLRRSRRARTVRRSRVRLRRTRRVRGTSRAKPTKTVLLPARRTNDGPIQLVVSLGKQRLTVYRNGEAVGTTRISSGQNGFETPQGIFSIIQKRRRHYSNIYRGAPMPFMQRLTWSGIALHQGHVPRYRASHGCIRLPSAFARSLFGFTQKRTHVIVTGGDPKPQLIAHPALFQPTPADPRPDPSANDTADANTRSVRYAFNTATSTATATKTDAGTPRRQTAATAVTGNPLFDADAAEMDAHRRLMRATKSQSPLRILITRRSERDKLRQAQNLLQGFGYDPGPADGLVGKQSVLAIKAFQSDEGLTVTGYPNRQFYDALYRKAGIVDTNPAFVYVRQDADDIYAAAIALKHPEQPLGAHLFLVTDFKPITGEAGWNATSLKTSARFLKRFVKGNNNAGEEASHLSPPSVGRALDRIEVPAHVRQRIEDLLTPGSSMIISDGGHTRETGQDTDFIVLTR